MYNMKKILFLLLLPVMAVAQIPMPRSTTTFSNVRASGSGTITGKLRVGSTTAPSATLDVTGTMSVSGTSTLTGAVNFGSTGSFGSTVNSTGFLVNGSTALNSSNGTRVTLAASGAYTACEVTTGKPLILNSASLTGGNTGTVAVLSDAVFPVTFSPYSSSPGDGNTLYFGNTSFPLTSSSSSGTITIPYNCTLVSWTFNSISSGGAASAETSTLAINGTTNYTLSTAITFSAAGLYNGFSGSSLSQNFNAGDIINAKMVCPTWVTNPTSVYCGLTLWFVRRQ